MEKKIEVVHTYTKDVLLPIIKRVKSYMETEMKIDIFNVSEIAYPKNIHLKKNTIMLGTSGSIKLIITLGYDDILLNKLVEMFVDGDDVDDYESEEVRNSVACEISNTIIGNAIDNPIDNSDIYITPPVLVSEAKTLYKDKFSKFVFVTFATKYGDVQLTAVGPKEQFEEELDFKEI